MFSTIYSGAVCGLQAYLIRVEVDLAGGLPAFLMVGSLGSEVRESRERVCVAMKNSGFQIPPGHITVNLAPADRRKDGTAFDLPIAIGLLQDMELLKEDAVKDTLFLGELGLNGEIKKAKGVLPIVREATRRGIHRVIVPRENALEAAVIPGVTVWGVGNLGELFTALVHPGEDEEKIYRPRVCPEDLLKCSGGDRRGDFREVAGQESARRGALIAAAGFHNLLMMGPPGVGKSMIAGRIPGILPPLTLEESIEVSKIYSICGLLKPDTPLVLQRPFRSPHHSTTAQAMAGGGRNPKPGEISLASYGTLFLDELTEFQPKILDLLRQPMEEGSITVSRLNQTVVFPAKTMIAAAMNPCKCGYYPDMQKCRCTAASIERYINRISQPLLDRIDICVETPQIKFEELNGTKKEECSDTIRERVIEVHAIQKKRYQKEDFQFNSQIPAARIAEYCALSKDQEKYMKKIYKQLNLTARSYHKILKVARTLADMDGSENILDAHLNEAVCYRNIDKRFWRDSL